VYLFRKCAMITKGGLMTKKTSSHSDEAVEDNGSGSVSSASVADNAKDGVSDDVNGLDNGWLIRTSVLLSCILSIVSVAFVAYSSGSGGNYASIYLVPNSYSNVLDGNTVKFTYGTKVYGIPSEKNLLNIYVGDNLVATRDLNKKSGINDVVLQVPEGINLPVRVKLALETDYGVDAVHFWIKSKGNDNSTGQ
jgi:hypothetical protein